MREASKIPAFSGGLFCALALLAALSAPADASGILLGYMSGIPRSTLTNEDWSAFRSSAQKLLDEAPAKPGESRNWQGPSGASGTLAIQRVFEKSGMPCRDVNASFNARNASDSGRSYVLTVCRDTAGNWKIAS